MSEQQTFPSEWFMGKMAGAVRACHNGWSVVFQGEIKIDEYFGPLKHKTSEIALEKAKARQIELNKLHQLTKNDWRYVDAEKIEVKLDKNYTMLTDAIHLPLIKETTWSADIKGNSVVYAAGNFKKNGKRVHIHIHRLIMPCDANYTIDHINGCLLNETVLDNRLSNLRIATRKEQANNRSKQSNNTSGIHGVILYRNKWIAQWKIGKKSCSKEYSFGPRSLLTSDEAREKAIQKRKEMAELLKCTNGERECLGLQKRKAESETEQPRLTKRVTTTITEFFSTTRDNETVD